VVSAVFIHPIDPVFSNELPVFPQQTNGFEVIQQVAHLNQGQYLHDEVQNTNPSNFCIGVAGYPEKHFESPNSKADLRHLKAKVDAGAEYIVTQMFFDNAAYFSFVVACRAAGINVPIVPGLKPLTSASQLSTVPRHFSVTLPDDLVDAIEAAKSPEAVKQAGVEWTIAQSKELLAAGVPVLHYYTMGKAEETEKIARALF
jgi:methylenetetrahydrofolate reductase (NADPH)